MENYCKIIIILLFIGSCNLENTKQINSNFANVELEYLEKSKYIGGLHLQNDTVMFSIKSVNCNDDQKHNGLVSFNKIQTDSSHFVDLALIIDTQSFRLLGIKKEEMDKIRNEYHQNGRMNAYYIDKKNVYAFVDKDIPEFNLLGSIKDLIILGGNYIQVGSKIYADGKLLKDVDVGTFKTMDLLPDDDRLQWYYTVGLDKSNIYYNEKKMSKADFIRIFGDKTEIGEKYFK